MQPAAIPPSTARVIPIQARIKAAPPAARKFEVKCSSCNVREMCLPEGLNSQDMASFEEVVYTRRRIKRGEALFAAGGTFNAVYAIRSGFFKVSVVDGEGREQVTGFSMGGELLGLDGIGTGLYSATATALEDAEVCVLPFARLEDLAARVRAFRRSLHIVLSREIVRDHGVMMLLGSMRAEERLAAFLLNLAKRFTRRGYSPSEFHLRMTREEIGSYLGLKLETVSRLFSRFQDLNLLSVQHKHVRILNSEGLEAMLATVH